MKHEIAVATIAFNSIRTFVHYYIDISHELSLEVKLKKDTKQKIDQQIMSLLLKALKKLKQCMHER